MDSKETVVDLAEAIGKLRYLGKRMHAFIGVRGEKEYHEKMKEFLHGAIDQDSNVEAANWVWSFILEMFSDGRISKKEKDDYLNYGRIVSEAARILTFNITRNDL